MLRLCRPQIGQLHFQLLPFRSALLQEFAIASITCQTGRVVLKVLTDMGLPRPQVRVGKALQPCRA